MVRQNSFNHCTLPWPQGRSCRPKDRARPIYLKSTIGRGFRPKIAEPYGRIIIIPKEILQFRRNMAHNPHCKSQVTALNCFIYLTSRYVHYFHQNRFNQNRTSRPIHFPIFASPMQTVNFAKANASLQYPTLNQSRLPVVPKWRNVHARLNSHFPMAQGQARRYT